MSTLSVDDLIVILGAHTIMTITNSGTRFFLDTEDKRRVRWHCQCGATGGVQVDPVRQDSGNDLSAALWAAGRRHVAEVVAAAVGLAERDVPSLGEDELAERYMELARRMLGVLNGGPSGSVGVSIAWRIDQSIVDAMTRHGWLDKREGFGTLAHELHGIALANIEPRGVVLSLDLAQRAAYALHENGQGGVAEQVESAIQRATELDGDDPVFELVIS